MRRFIGNSLLVGVAAAGAIVLSATAAFATGWTVDNPNDPPDPSFTASLHSGTVATYGDASTGQSFTCTSSALHGSAPSGTSLPNPVATITSGSFGGCNGTLGGTMTVTFGSANVNGWSYDSVADTVGGNITGISAQLTISSVLGTCTATMAGELDTVTYDNVNAELAIKADTDPKLTIVSATGSGCAGLVNTGDKVTLAATYDVTPHITIRPTP